MSIVTDWTLLCDDNMEAVESFVQGDGLRTLVKSLNSPEARTEVYRLEKHVGAEKARIRAKRALSRYRRNYC